MTWGGSDAYHSIWHIVSTLECSLKEAHFQEKGKMKDCLLVLVPSDLLINTELDFLLLIVTTQSP